MKIGMLPLRSTDLSEKHFLVELGRKFRNNPNEGDVVSLTMFVECIMEPSHRRDRRGWDYGYDDDDDHLTRWENYARRFACQRVNRRLKYRLLVSFSSLYDFLLI